MSIGTTSDPSTTTDQPPEQDASEICLRLVHGLPNEHVLDEAKRAARRGEIHNRALCFWLAEIDERGISVIAGVPNTVEFARRVLDISRRQARELIATGRALNELPRIDQAFARGVISWSKVRLLTRIATPQTEEEWLARALACTTHELEREVATSQRGRRPRDNRKGLPTIRTKIVVRADPVLEEMWQACQRKFQTEAGSDVTTDAVLRALCDGFLRQGPAGGEGSLYRMVLNRCVDCHQTELVTEEGLVPLDPSLADQIACDASHTVINDADGVGQKAVVQPDAKPDAPSDAPSTPTPESAAGDDLPAAVVRAADAALRPAAIDDPTPPWLRRKVVLRDGLHCVHCRCSCDLMVHHLVFRSKHGPTAMKNLTTLCFRCHGLVHDGYLRVEGTAPHGLRFLDREGRAVLATEGLRDPSWRVFQLKTDGARAPLDAAAGGETDPAAAEGEGASTASNASTTALEPRVETTFDTLPERAGADWFARHAHLITWNERRGAFELTPGYAVDPIDRKRRVNHVQHVDRVDCADPSGPREGLHSLIGQPDIVARLSIAVEAAKIQDRPIEHVLFTGGPGLGKTSFARALAADVGRTCHAATATLLTDPVALIGLLTRINRGDVLFIDEIHALRRRLAETLYEAMQDRQLTLPLTDGLRTDFLVIDVVPFTLAGATTDPERMPAPFVSRFPLRVEVADYAVAELATIVTRAAASEQPPMTITAEAAAFIGTAGCGAPRRALGHWSLVRDFAVAHVRHEVTVETVREAFAQAGLDELGMGEVHRRIVKKLREIGRPIGICRLAGILGITKRTLRDIYEPDLLRHNLIATTPRGLVAATVIDLPSTAD